MLYFTNYSIASEINGISLINGKNNGFVIYNNIDLGIQYGFDGFNLTINKVFCATERKGCFRYSVEFVIDYNQKKYSYHTTYIRGQKTLILSSKPDDLTGEPSEIFYQGEYIHKITVSDEISNLLDNILVDTREICYQIYNDSGCDPNKYLDVFNDYIQNENKVLGEAQRIGERMLISKISVPCIDVTRTMCNTDIIFTYIAPDGSIEEEREHKDI